MSFRGAPRGRGGGASRGRAGGFGGGSRGAATAHDAQPRLTACRWPRKAFNNHMDHQIKYMVRQGHLVYPYYQLICLRDGQVRPCLRRRNGLRINKPENTLLQCSSIQPRLVDTSLTKAQTAIGKVDEILGPINQVYFTIKPQEGIVATSFKTGDKFFIGGDKLLPLERSVLDRGRIKPQLTFALADSCPSQNLHQGQLSRSAQEVHQEVARCVAGAELHEVAVVSVTEAEGRLGEEEVLAIVVDVVVAEALVLRGVAREERREVEDSEVEAKWPAMTCFPMAQSKGNGVTGDARPPRVEPHPVDLERLPSFRGRLGLRCGRASVTTLQVDLEHSRKTPRTTMSNFPGAGYHHQVLRLSSTVGPLRDMAGRRKAMDLPLQGMDLHKVISSSKVGEDRRRNNIKYAIEAGSVDLTPDRSVARAAPAAILQWTASTIRFATSRLPSMTFYLIGHGGQTEDLDGDEDDGYDEVIYPVDFRQVYSRSRTLPKKPDKVCLGLVSSYARGDLGGMASTAMGFFKKATTGDSTRQRNIQTKTSPADVIMWSGSKDSQTSADANIAGQATGAMSWAFINALKKNPQQSYVQLLNSIRAELEGNYDQKPQLSCSHPLSMSPHDEHRDFVADVCRCQPSVRDVSRSLTMILMGGAGACCASGGACCASGGATCIKVNGHAGFA
ncbi:hypothetical protein MRB53_039389 [Persea americana]|nr:hypothetical protein MRB53_039389 [Persea americana]